MASVKYTFDFQDVEECTRAANEFRATYNYDGWSPFNPNVIDIYDDFADLAEARSICMRYGGRQR